LVIFRLSEIQNRNYSSSARHSLDKIREEDTHYSLTEVLQSNGTCSLLIISDYFFSQRFNFSISDISNYIVDLVGSADVIFRYIQSWNITELV